MTQPVREQVVVIEADSPYAISIRKNASTGKDFSEFDKLNNELTCILGSSSGYAQFTPSDVAIGKNYIARVAERSHQWCRVRVEDIMQGATIYKVICQLIDYGQMVTLDKHCLRQVHQKYFSLPAQIKSVSLANIVPATLITNLTTLNSELGENPNKLWNPSAVQYLKSLVVGRLNVWVEYVQGSSHQVIMYIGDLCVNDELVKRRMALPRPIPVQQPKKIMSFAEFEERERLLEAMENNDHQGEEPSSKQLSKDLAACSTSSKQSVGTGKFTVKGRGQALLDSIEETSTSPRRDSFSPPGMMRLPKSHSAAETISALKFQDCSDSYESGNEVPMVSTHRRRSSNALSETRSSSPSGSDSSNSYQRARRPKLSNMKSSASHGDTALLIKSPNSSHAAAQRSSPSLLLNRTEPASSDIHTVYNSSPYPQIESSPYPQVESSPYPQVSSPYSQGSSPYRQVGSPYSQGSSPYRQVESFSGLGFEAGDSSLNAADSQRVYEKQQMLAAMRETSQQQIRLISPQTASDADVSRISAISYDESRARAMKKQVTVFSDVPITPVFGITYSKLHERALRHWRSLGGSDKKPPHILQAYAWPALRRGMELIAISDPFYMEGRDGVSLSYLMAIATLLFDLDSYMCLPKGNGPRCLILCASWKKAEQIHFHVTSLFGDKPEKSLLVLHGRRETEHKLYCQLINGADVIVSTPCTFIRMLEAGHVNVIRLCHLVIDDADIIAKEFPQELSGIMKRLGEAVSQNPDRAAPRQIALFSSSWTKRLAVFRTEYMTAPVTLFTNKIEAAIACNVKQMVHFIEHENQRLGVMIKLVKESGTPSIKLVVCTHSDGDASKVYKALKAYSYDVYVAMKSLHDLDQTLQQWEEVRSANSYPILVITDEVLNLLISDDNAVVDAKYVLHYNMPASKRLLGMRLHCLSSHYAANSEDIMLASHIIFSPRDHKTATTLVRILERTGGRIPAQLAQLSIDSIERNESGKKKELCDYMKSYGVCRDQLKCNSRHLVSAQLDTPSAHLPTSGDVEFKVVSVKDAATCYARLIRHRDINGVQRDIESKKFALDLSLQTYYTQPHVCIPIDPATVEEGRLCVYEKDKMYYRAQILSNNTDANVQHTPEISIRLLDEGLVLKISINQLFELPPESNLELHPPEIVEVKICKLKPMDHDIDWSVEANAYMSQLLQGEILSGKIQLCIGNTLWCDPIVKRQYLTEFSLWVSLWYASLRLIGNVNSGHLATRNLEHLQLLRRACEGKIQLPAVASSKRTMKSSELLPEETETEVVLSLPTRQLDEGSASHVYLSEVDNPDRIFVILTDEHERLTNMEDELQEVMKQRGKVPLKNFSLRTLCVAQYPDSEQRWCRCVVISSSDQKVQLLSIDYGLLFEADIGQVCSLPASPEDLRLLSYQAIECYMATVMPVGGVWSDETGDLLWELGSNSTSLYAKVLTTKPSTFLGDTSYGIELIERKQHEQDLYFSKLLLSKQLALERKLNIMEQLGLSCEADHLDYPFQLIPRLVRLLNKTANHERRLLIVAYIRQLVLDSLNLKDEMRQQGVLKSLCNLVNTVNLQDDILSHVLESFAALTFNNLENCEELWWENGFTFLHEKLELCDDNGLLTRVLSCLSCLIKANCIRTEADSLVSFSTNLIHIARSSTLPQNKRLSLEVLNSYLDKDIKRANSLLRGDIVRVTTGLLLTSDDVIEASCILIDSLILALPKQSDTASWDTTISQMAVTMFKVKSETALQHCAKTLHTLLNNLPGAKTILKNTVLHAKLERLVNSGLNSLTREVCINILVKVRPECPVPQTDTRPRTNNRKEQHQSIKSSQELYLQPLVKSEPPTFMNQIPKVLWWECSKFLMIQVQVHDALTLDPPPSLTYKAEKLHFSCGPYQFTLGPLYDTIVSKKSGREIYSSEIKYALYKEKRKLWSNLMKPGYKKPSYVQSNMDLMITSSDDEEGIDYSKSPFLIKPTPTLKYSPFERIQPGTSIPAELPPPVDELLSSDEKEEEEDERFDHEYKKQYDFFNV